MLVSDCVKVSSFDGKPIVMSELWYLRIFEGVRRDCDVKYDVRYHKIAQNFIQIVLECQKMIR